MAGSVSSLTFRLRPEFAYLKRCASAASYRYPFNGYFVSPIIFTYRASMENTLNGGNQYRY